MYTYVYVRACYNNVPLSGVSLGHIRCHLKQRQLRRGDLAVVGLDPNMPANTLGFPIVTLIITKINVDIKYEFLLFICNSQAWIFVQFFSNKF